MKPIINITLVEPGQGDIVIPVEVTHKSMDARVVTHKGKTYVLTRTNGLKARFEVLTAPVEIP